MTPRRALWIVLAVSLLLDARGLRWGLPSEYGWAPDEILPADVDAAAARHFAGGWFSKYPPLPFAVLAAVAAPVRALVHAGGGDDDAVRDARMTAGRALSLALGLGLLVVLYLCGGETGERWAGVGAAALVALTPTFVYYAKMGNLDVPYLFWFALSLLFFLRAWRRARVVDVVLFALAAALAVATKDQAFALYVLTVPALAWRLRRPRLLLLLAGAGLAAFAVLGGVVFNPGGWLDHVRLIAGPASADFRMFDAGPAGRAELLWQSGRHLAFVMGVPSLVVCLAGVVLAARDRARSDALLATLVPAVSYVLFFLLVVLYVYDRFLLPVAIVLSLFGGLLLARAGRRVPLPAGACTAVLVLYSLGRAASVDVLLARDSRYGAESWLAREVGPGPLVAAVGPLEYLPRLDGLHWRRLGPSATRLTQVQPDVVVVNADYARRADPGTGERAFYTALEDGSAGYAVAIRLRSAPRTLLDTDAWRREDRGRIWSNLDKIDPEIVVYRRK